MIINILFANLSNLVDSFLKFFRSF